MKLHSLLIFIITASLAQADLLISGIKFGDNRAEVTRKLQKSELVKSDVPTVMLTRVGLNGSFKTTNHLNGKKFFLYFNWSSADSLDELTFRSSEIHKSYYDSQLKILWSDAIQLISSIHGKSQKVGQYPESHQLQEGGIRFSHEWKVQDGYIYLGTGMEGGKVHLIITFSKDQKSA